MSGSITTLAAEAPSSFVVSISESSTALAAAAYKLLIDDLALGKTPGQSLALAGGSTPKALYSLMVQGGFTDSDAGKSVAYCFGDVRMVPNESPDSNYTMAYTSLLHAVPPESVLAVDTSKPAAVAAEEYTKALMTRLPTTTAGGGPASLSVPVFDVVLLGLGPDGHTASLFPGTAAPLVMDAVCTTCMPPEGTSPYVERVTVTTPVIQAAKNVVVLATGVNKAWVLRGIFGKNDDGPTGAAPPALPVSRLLRGCRGRVFFLLDKAAAGEE